MVKKRSRPPQATLPNPGEVFLMPLEDGRFGVCRVLRENTEAERNAHGCRCILVASSSWIGSEAPSLDDPQVRTIQKLTHHSWKKQLNICWVSDPPPVSFQRIGVIEPTRADKHLQCMSSGGWSFAYQVLMEWRWEHDREAVLREDTECAEQRARTLQSTQRPTWNALTLEQLKTKRRFSKWKGHAPDKAISACRAIFRETTDALVALGTRPDQAAILVVLQQCIERLNKLDVEHEHFIETTIREDLCDDFD